MHVTVVTAGLHKVAPRKSSSQECPLQSKHLSEFSIEGQC